MQVEEIISRLRSGQVGVMPSDTVYGLMCVARDPNAVAQLYRLKQRDSKPGTLIGASTEQFIELGLAEEDLILAQHYWPGPVSVVVPGSTTSEYLHQGKDSLAVRIPDNTLLQEICRETGALQTSSANITGQPVATTIDQARAYFGDKVDFYVDGGDLSHNQPSTIIQIKDGVTNVLRQGAQQVVS